MTVKYGPYDELLRDYIS